MRVEMPASASLSCHATYGRANCPPRVRRDFVVLVTVKKGETLSEQAYQIIRKAIVFHELRPGEALIEEKLSEALSISRTPLRTALRRLIDEGLADAQGKNIVVSDLTPEDVANIRQVRLTLELLVMDELRGKVTPTLIAQLQDTLLRQQKIPMNTADDYMEYIQQDSRFHITLAKATQNRFLYDLICRINAHSSRCLMLSMTLYNAKPVAVEEHREIIEALAARDYDHAYAAMDLHIQGVDQRLI